MQKLTAVILAAGRGTRFHPLTHTTPKPLIKIAGKPSMVYNMDAMAPYVDEFVIVTGYLKEKFEEQFNGSYKGIPVILMEQKEQKGTSDALLAAKDHIKNDSFFLIYGDDLYHPDFFKLLSEKDDCAIGQIEENWQSYGIFQVKDGKYLDKLVEKPSTFIGKLANIGVYRLKKEIFTFADEVNASVRGEYEVTDLVTYYAQRHPVEVVEVKEGWQPLSYPWHILSATEQVLQNIETKIDGTVEQGATIHGKVILGKNSVIKAGSYLDGNFIIGENTIIGPNCHLRKFAAIGNNCVIGFAVEVTASVIGDYVDSKHHANLTGSIIGNNVNIAAGTMIANLRHDNTNVKMMINGKLVDTGRRKLGAVIGDNAKIGLHTSIYPGRKIYDGVWTLPGEIVKEDKIK